MLLVIVNLWKRLGWKAVGVLLILSGLAEQLPRFLAARDVDTIKGVGMGIIVLIFGRKLDSFVRMWVDRQADKIQQGAEPPPASSPVVTPIKRELDRRTHDAIPVVK